MKQSGQNRLKVTDLARESLRDVSVRTTASLATALLVDLKIGTKENASHIIDPSKVQRARELVMKEESHEASAKLEGFVLLCIFFDGRCDKTKMIVVDEDGSEFARTDWEEHYTVTDPYNYLTHITPEEGSGAKGVSELMCEWLDDVGQLSNIKYAGGDSTNPITG